MRKFCLLLFLITTSFNIQILAQERLQVEGLEKPVEILIDQWGIPHIYAETEADLFFGQGFNAARDRLFQFEIWRRQSNGTVAEILGPRELKRDIGTRLFQFRGDIQREMNYYHPRGALIITSFVRGVNAYIDWVLADEDRLPLEFGLLGIKPQKWTPEVVISRHQGLLGNIGEEMDVARAVALLGPEAVKDIAWFHPNEPDLTIDARIDSAFLFKDILEFYNAYRRPIDFRPEDLVASVRAEPEDYRLRWAANEKVRRELEVSDQRDIGSNNWVVRGEHTQSGYPMMANDPHRRHAAPSLRYMTHLVGPGWNVIGGGEPEIPGISIGHNEYGAWGLTVFETDAEDLYVYETHPDDPNQYRYQGSWEAMRIIHDTIPVEGQDPVIIDLKYTRHGPVLYEDPAANRACALRCGWLEIGGSPYLASLRMDQARNFEEFREACNYSHIPGENMVWADREGNIGWQAVGIAPIRRHFSGLVPVWGNGDYEWDGYLPIKAKPHVYNPEEGYFATANENVTPPDYPYPDALAFSWSDPYRGDRVAEFLRSGRLHSLPDMAALQTDYLSIPARQLTPLLRNLEAKGKRVEAARQMLLNWDHRLEPNSVAAGIYHAWEKNLRSGMEELVIPEVARSYLSLQMKKVIDRLLLPDDAFGKDVMAGRDAFLMESLEKAIAQLTDQLGDDVDNWQYGQVDYKHVIIRHPLSNAVKPDLRRKLDVGPAVRGGNSFTVNNTGTGDRQTHGASFRLIVDTGNWDHALGTNAPGQSGDPDNPFYRNLFDIWAKDRFFPVFYSREKVEAVEAERIVLEPGK